MEIGDKINKLTLLSTFRNTNDTHWRGVFQCDCGKIKTIRLYLVAEGKQKACGCLKGQSPFPPPNKLESGEAGFNALFKSYMVSAKERKRDFTLTKDEFRKLTISKCYYCGTEPNQLFGANRSNGKYKYNGIDRKDNNRGYIKENCVPCCGNCNICKGKMDYEDFILLSLKIAQRFL